MHKDFTYADDTTVVSSLSHRKRHRVQEQYQMGQFTAAKYRGDHISIIKTLRTVP